MTLEEARENMVVLFVQHLRLSAQYERDIFKDYDQDRRDRVLKQYLLDQEDIDEQYRIANEELLAAYASLGVPYSGTKCKTEYNMYTYREIEREALRRYRKDI